jgi:hypothetical protein
MSCLGCAVKMEKQAKTHGFPKINVLPALYPFGRHLKVLLILLMTRRQHCSSSYGSMHSLNSQLGRKYATK